VFLLVNQAANRAAKLADQPRDKEGSKLALRLSIYGSVVPKEYREDNIQCGKIVFSVPVSYLPTR